jgi:acylphosphatase
MLRCRLVITGHVQNVFYRDWPPKAEALGLDGRVRNRADGSVEAIVQGLSEMVVTIIDRARPRLASRVDAVAVGKSAAPSGRGSSSVQPNNRKMSGARKE